MIQILDMLGNWIFSALVFILLLYYAKESLNGKKLLQEEIASNRDRIFNIEKKLDLNNN